MNEVGKGRGRSLMGQMRESVGHREEHGSFLQQWEAAAGFRQGKACCRGTFLCCGPLSVEVCKCLK